MLELILLSAGQVSGGAAERKRPVTGPYDAGGNIVTDVVLQALREQLGEYYRSTIVHIENHGDETLKLVGGSTPLAGKWFDGSGKGWMDVFVRSLLWRGIGPGIGPAW